MPSVVAEIGDALEKHFTMIGLLKKPDIPAHQQSILDEKRAQFDAANSANKKAQSTGSADDLAFPEEAQLCNKYHTKAAILMDGCLTCLSCGDSKCG